MNTRIITHVKHFISTPICLLLALTAMTDAHADWTVDLSRRVQETRAKDLQEADPGQVSQQFEPPKKNFFESLFEPGQVAQEIVVLNTEKGFVPSQLRLKRGLVYQIHVVNVNDKEKNVSFVLDSFSEHHATYYGKIKTFQIRPQKEGVFKFVSPETSAQGKLVVYPSDGAAPGAIPAGDIVPVPAPVPATPAPVRAPASEE